MNFLNLIGLIDIYNVYSSISVFSSHVHIASYGSEMKCNRLYVEYIKNNLNNKKENFNVGINLMKTTYYKTVFIEIIF